MPRLFIYLEAGCLQVNLMSTSAQINQLKYTILYYTLKRYDCFGPVPYHIEYSTINDLDIQADMPSSSIYV